MSKESVYDEQISPLMAEIIKICKENKIPAFCSFGLDPNQEDDTEQEDGLPSTLWCTTSLPISERKSDNTEINKLYKVRYEGYDVVAPFTAFTIRTIKDEV